MQEQWLPVVGFEDSYAVSNLGNVQRTRPAKGATLGKNLKGKINRDGYVVITLCDAPNPDTYKFAHVLVLEAFVGPRPVGKETRHLNGVPNDNNLDNLVWGTPVENSADMDQHGHLYRGDQHPNAKLSNDQIEVIRSSRLGQKLLGHIYGVSQQHISDIQNRKKRIQ